MAHVGYDVSTLGGRQIVQIFADYNDLRQRIKAMSAWILSVNAGGDGSALQSDSHFVAASPGAALRDSFVQFAERFEGMATGQELDAQATEEIVARMARGA
jgi:hypothetical protein